MTALLSKLHEPTERFSIDEWTPHIYSSRDDCSCYGYSVGRRYAYEKFPHPTKKYRFRKSWRRRRVTTSHVVSLLHSKQCEQEQSVDSSEIEFNLLADQWEDETRNISSPKAIMRHPAVQKIVEMGDGAVPMILRRMADRPWFWFGVLMQITKEPTDPIDPSMRGDMQKMTEAWLKWGRDRGVI
jgi:hypothetical protein